MLEGLAKDAIGLLNRMAGIRGLTQCDAPRAIQLFGTIQTGELSSTYVPITTVINASEQIPCFYKSPVERLWRVRTAGVELQRFTGDGLPPLTNSAIRGPQIPAGASRGGSVTYKFQVHVCSNSGNYVFLMDGGQPIEVYGNSIEVSVVGPANAFEVTPQNNTITRSGLLIDTIVGVSILAAEEAIGQPWVHFTEHFAIPANTQPVIPVPQHARALKVYTGTGTPAAAWTRHIGDPVILGASLVVGTVNFTGNTSQDLSIPIGDETHLRVDLDPNNARFFTIVWTIRP